MTSTSANGRAGRCRDLPPGTATLAFVTPCSAEKDAAGAPLPAIERYTDPRIREVEAAARQAGADFLIFSGEFGLLEASTPIPHYDHLLLAEEVREHASQVARQLRQRGLDRILFFTAGLEKDPLLGPYHDCLEQACELAAVGLTFMELAA
ncbi:MAG: hypothetical protein P1V51_13345 [Deltaproteobacteria bacterium]|nr:hypothetical protein [Deltaproteobacteria bacterium]